MNNSYYSYQEAAERGKSHKRLYQYTDIKALEKILTNCSLRCTRADKLNDVKENEKIIDIWKKKIYVSCFTHRDYESYFFWKTYALKKEENITIEEAIKKGIMLSFEVSTLTDLEVYSDSECNSAPLSLCKMTDDSVNFDATVNTTFWGVFDYSFIDVSYVSRNDSLEQIDNFQGRVKYHEWDMECETRLRIAIRSRGEEVQYENGVFSYYTPNEEYLYVKLSEECLKNMTITLSPFADNESSKAVDTLLKKLRLDGVIEVKNSVLMSEVKE